jgi:hypothetical protein
MPKHTALNRACLPIPPLDLQCLGLDSNQHCRDSESRASYQLGYLGKRRKKCATALGILRVLYQLKGLNLRPSPCKGAALPLS